MNYVSERPFRDTEGAAEYLKQQGVKRSAKTLVKLRCVGGGPEYFNFGRSVLYTEAKLDEYVRGMLRPMLATTVPAQAA